MKAMGATSGPLTLTHMDTTHTHTLQHTLATSSTTVGQPPAARWGMQQADPSERERSRDPLVLLPLTGVCAVIPIPNELHFSGLTSFAVGDQTA